MAGIKFYRVLKDAYEVSNCTNRNCWSDSDRHFGGVYFEVRTLTCREDEYPAVPSRTLREHGARDMELNLDRTQPQRYEGESRDLAVCLRTIP
jgi:hypothetical protein